MISSLRQNDRDNCDISSILEGLWRVTDELIKMVQYGVVYSMVTWRPWLILWSTRDFIASETQATQELLFKSLIKLIIIIIRW